MLRLVLYIRVLIIQQTTGIGYDIAYIPFFPRSAKAAPRAINFLVRILTISIYCLYLHSSARDDLGIKGVLEIKVLEMPMRLEDYVFSYE